MRRERNFCRSFCCLLSSIIFVLLSQSACRQSPSLRGLTVAGSTSIQPFADKWAEVYMKQHPGRIVNVQGGGSSAGIHAARVGAADIGTSSRDLRPEEKDLLEIVVAWDGLAIIVHPENEINDLSMGDVKNIFAGNLRNWKELGGPDKIITLVTREEGSGTRGAFQELVMGRSRIFKGAIVQDSNGTVREIVANDPNGIGYISLGLVNEQVKAVSLDEITPDIENIDQKKYKLIRPFLFVTNGPPRAESQDFINFVLSRKGQELISKEGLIPIFRE